jgi:hypothetical protein
MLVASLIAGAAVATVAQAERLDGTVVTGNRQLAGAKVRLYAGGATAVERGSARTRPERAAASASPTGRRGRARRSTRSRRAGRPRRAACCA